MPSGLVDAAAAHRRRVRLFVEFLVVGGASLFAILYLIPSQTSASENWGLSPRMVPTVCAAVIGGLSAINLLVDLLRAPPGEGEAPVVGLWTVLAVVVSAVVGVVVIDAAGLIAGGTVMVPLVSLSLGERRPLNVVGLTAGTALLLYLVIWSGL